jgi:predicted RNA-binding protein Jag
MTHSLRYTTTAMALLLIIATASAAEAADDIVSADTRAWAAEKLDTAEAALQRGDMETAWKATEAAADAPTDFHGRGLALVSARALGDELYGRIYQLRKSIRTRLGREAEAQGLVYGQPGAHERDKPWEWDYRDALGWYQGAPDADALIRLARTAPADRHILLRMLGSISANDEGEIEYGVGRVGSGISVGHEPLRGQYVPLPEEVAIQQRFEDEVIPTIIGRMQQEADELMAEEQTLYDRPMTDMEKQASVGDWEAMAAAVAGVEAEEPPDPEVRLRLWRSGDSQKLLRQAKDWYETLTVRVRVDGETRIRRAVAVPVLEVATKRADELMAIGDDTSVPLTARADAYGDAQDYYAIADNRERTDLAYQKQVALQPELDAYREKREAALEKAAEEGRGMAAEMEKAVKDMEKTEEEKEAFKEEADALEDELGF